MFKVLMIDGVVWWLLLVLAISSSLSVVSANGNYNVFCVGYDNIAQTELKKETTPPWN